MQLKLNKNVGKNCTPDVSDVMIVQTCLANIKAKTKFGLKPLWQGKVDGKNSRELVSAIEAFEVSEGLRITGRIDAFGGQTWSKLKQRTPTPILDRLTKDPFMGDLPNDHILKAKQEELKQIIQAIRSLPHMSVGPYLEKYWTTLKELGDPIAQIALNIHLNRFPESMTAVPLLRAHLGDLFLAKFPPAKKELEYRPEYNRGQGGIIPTRTYRERQNEWIDDYFRRIQVAIALLHWDTAAKDRLDKLGLLNARQITTYHHIVFENFGLPKTAFGGTYFNPNIEDWPSNLGAKFWCTDCDIFR